jgi:20S proteasome alpha/beta subunit
MTFQVGIVAVDGVVLASDSRYSDGHGQTWTASKLKIHEPAAIVYCCAGDNSSSIAADHFRESYNPSVDIEQVLNSAYQYVRNTGLQQYYGALLVAAKRQSRFELWCLEAGTQGEPRPDLIQDRRYIGNHDNKAGFFLERYIPKVSPAGQSISLESAIFIAAHSVFMAAKLNPSGVDNNLEIVVCRNERGIQRITGEQISELAQRSGALDAEIANRFGV